MLRCGNSPLASASSAPYRRDMAKDRLTRKTWIEAGLDQLVAAGPDALRAEPLARHVGTTKGSFYWHFKDVPDFHAAVLAHWQAEALAEIVTLLEREGHPTERLRQFGLRITANTADPALRAWARSNPEVSQVLAQVDAERLKYLSAVLGTLGVTNKDYHRAAYGTLIGLLQIPGTDDAGTAAYEALIDLILALR